MGYLSVILFFSRTYLSKFFLKCPYLIFKSSLCFLFLQGLEAEAFETEFWSRDDAPVIRPPPLHRLLFGPFPWFIELLPGLDSAEALEASVIFVTLNFKTVFQLGFIILQVSVHVPVSLMRLKWKFENYQLAKHPSFTWDTSCHCVDVWWNLMKDYRYVAFRANSLKT